MKRAIEWMVDNHVTVNLVMLLFIFAGAVSSLKINQEIFPEIVIDVVSVQVVYRGATPEDVENSVVTKIEEAIADVTGIERISSTSSEGVGVVSAELEIGADAKDIKDKIETEVNRILTFPINSEKPVITIAERNRSVIQVAITGKLSFDEMNKLSKRVKDDLISLKGISQVSVSGTKNYEVNIEISEDKLNEFGLTYTDISNAIKTSSFDMPAGKIKRKNEEVLLRVKGMKYTAEDYRNIVLKSNFNGGVLKLKDVAKVKDSYEESDLYSYFNGKPAVMLNVYRTGNQSALKIAKTVFDYIKTAKENLPIGVEIMAWQNEAKKLEDRLDLMLRNAAMGFLLVLITLTLFLDLRLALWVSSGIIVSFMGSFVIMYWLGITINLISLFAFILVLGIVVDDAIVIGEEIYSNREKGVSPVESSKKGTTRVAIPVIFSILTTVATFSPMLFIDGRMGQVMYAVPVIVISILLLSLFDSIFILPAHLSSIKLESNTVLTKASSWLTSKVDKGLKVFLNIVLEPSLNFVLRFKFVSVAIFFAIFISSLGLLVGGTVKFQFFPEIESDNAVAYLSMPQGTSLSSTKKIIDRIEEAFEKTKLDYQKLYPNQKGELFKNIYVSIGEQPSTKKGPNGNKSAIADPSKAEINVELLSSEERSFSTKDVIKTWRKHLGKVAGIENLEFQSVLMSAGDAVSVEINGNDFNTLNTAIEEVKKKLGTYNGVYNIKDTFSEGKYEIKFSLKQRGVDLGVTLLDIASEVKNSFFGDEVMRVQRGTDEVKIRVQYPEVRRKSISDIKNMRIRTKSGLEVPLVEVASYKLGRGYSSIVRGDRRRIIRVTASVDETIANGNDINKSLKKFLNNDFKKRHYGVGINFEGAQKEQKKSMGSLILGFLIAIFIVYMLLAIPFKSYTQPFIIMLSIPFGLIGGLWAHLFLGYDFTFMSAIGVVALSGVVVNDSLVLVDYINELFKNEEDATYERKRELVIQAAKRRFRPILLTSITTFFGLLPMIFEESVQAQFLIPMAISLGFGIIFATIITLYLVPSGIMILEGIKEALSGSEKGGENV